MMIAIIAISALAVALLAWSALIGIIAAASRQREESRLALNRLGDRMESLQSQIDALADAAVVRKPPQSVIPLGTIPPLSFEDMQEAALQRQAKYWAENGIAE